MTNKHMYGGSLKCQKIELPYNPKIPLLGVYLEKTLIQKDTCTAILTAALFTRHGNNLNVHQQINKEDVVYILNRILLSYKNEIMPFAATWMDQEIIILS